MLDADWSAVISRWAHVGSVIVLVGGGVFLRFVVAPAAAALPDDEHTALRRRIMDRWRLFVHPLVGLILLSGCYNFYLRMHAERPWNMLAGIKILLGLFVLTMASILVGRSKGTQTIRDNWKFWLQINLIVALTAVLISGYMKFLPLRKIEGSSPSALTSER